jgi:hypothetical protein
VKANSIRTSHIGVKRGRSSPVMWNDTDDERDERPRNFEEQVEMRRGKKRLEDCELPEGFRLVTPQPRQFWMINQLVWAFKLTWARVDRNGVRGQDEYEHVARYEQRISDEVQLRWALDDFSRELERERGDVVAVEPGTRGTDPRLQVFLTMRVV